MRPQPHRPVRPRPVWAAAAAGILSALAAGAPPGESPKAPATQPASQPASRPATQPAPAFTIATYNINYGNPNLRLVAETILGCGADLVCLQETNRESEAYLRRALGRSYPHMAFHTAAGAGGFGLLSRRPPRTRLLPARHGLFGTVFARVTLGGREVEIANVHLRPSLPRRGDNAAGLLKMLQETEAVRLREIQLVHAALTTAPGVPTIVLGDFNTLPAMPAARFLSTKGFTDSFASVTPDADNHVTWHWKIGQIDWRFRLDYIFHSPHLATLRSRIVQSEASDHYLVVSTLAWAPKAAPKAADKPGPGGDPGKRGNK